MPDKYYYLIASLPYLKLGQPPPITGKDFILHCKKWLNHSNLTQVISADINDLKVNPEDGESLRRWKFFDLDLRRELAKVRKSPKAARLTHASPAITDVFAQETPLLMEKKLLKMRWDFLEEEGFGHHFDASALVVYRLKLQLLERAATFNKDKGKTLYDNLCEAVYE